MAQAGFRPKATALILNEGRADSTRAPLKEFGQIRQRWRSLMEANPGDLIESPFHQRHRKHPISIQAISQQIAIARLKDVQRQQ